MLDWELKRGSVEGSVCERREGDGAIYTASAGKCNFDKGEGARDKGGGERVVGKRLPLDLEVLVSSAKACRR